MLTPVAFGYAITNEHMNCSASAALLCYPQKKWGGVGWTVQLHTRRCISLDRRGRGLWKVVLGLKIPLQHVEIVRSPLFSNPLVTNISSLPCCKI